MRETPELTVIYNLSALSPLRTVFHNSVGSYSHQILIDLALNRSIKNTSFQKKKLKIKKNKEYQLYPQPGCSQEGTLKDTPRSQSRG